MVNRLKPLNLVDFTGGINLRPEAFQLQDNELPEMLNMEVDPRGGINTRKTWQAIGTQVTGELPWNPRSAWLHKTSTNVQRTFVADNNNVWMQLGADAFTSIAGVAAAIPHGADFASWGDTVYIARGSGITAGAPVRVGPTGIVYQLPEGWANDYTNPGATDTGIRADHVASHQGYLFAANTTETGVPYPTRVRWSHPNNPNRWAQPDYIDIFDGGQAITGLVPFSDRLLIFKNDSVWALYGYDADSWQLTNVSRTVGTHSPQHVTRNEGAVFFVAWNFGVFVYTERGNVEEISAQIRIVFQGQYMDDAVRANAWIGWVGRRLWCSLPYDGDENPPTDVARVFVFDPVLNSWTLFAGGDGMTPGPYIEGADAREDVNQVAFNRKTPYLLHLDASNDEGAIDYITPTRPENFSTHMRTRWIDAGAPTWRKSWRRPDLLLRSLNFASAVNVRVFHDFDSSNAQRSFFVYYTPDAVAAMYGNFNWGDGSVYGGGSSQTSSVERGSTMGRAGVVQLTLAGDPGVEWGLNGIILKFIPRRFR